MERVQRIEQALAIAGQQSALFILNIADHTDCSPSLWAFNGEQVQPTYLVTGNTDSAEALVKEQVEGVYAHFQCVTVVMEASIRDAAGQHTDALKVLALLPGTNVRLVLVLPYGEGPTFDRGFHLTEREGVPTELDLERIRSTIFGTIDHVTRFEPGSALETIPRTVSDTSPGEIVSRAAGMDPFEFWAGMQELAHQGVNEAHARIPPLPRLATLAPFALFLRVAQADGKIEPSEVSALLTALARPTDPGLANLVATCPAAPRDALALLRADPSLELRALAAAGLVCAHEGGRAALLELARTIALAHGTISAAEQAAIAALDAALDAGLDATYGPDPFASLGQDSMEFWMMAASLAPFAGFMVTSAADGQVDNAELQVFMEALQQIDDPLLVAMLNASPLPIPRRLEMLTADPSRIQDALHAAGEIFRRNPLGDLACAAFVELLGKVAGADGEVSAREEEILGRVVQLLGMAPSH